MKEKCRACLLEYQNMVNIFKPSVELEISLADMISQSTGFPVHKGDPFPDFICLLCLKDTQNAYRTRQAYEPDYDLTCQVKEEIIDDSLGEAEYNKSKGSQYSEETDHFVCLVKNEPLEEDFLDKDIFLTAPYQIGDQNEDLSYEKNKKVKASSDEALSLNSPYCAETFRSKYFLNLHKHLHMKKQKYSCIHCPKTFLLPDALLDHMHTHNALFEEEVCQMSNNENDQFDEIKVDIFEADDKYNSDGEPDITDYSNLLRCPRCPKMCKRTQDLKAHQRNHFEQPQKCPHCPKSFGIISTFNRHLRVHKKEKSVMCSFCPKAYKNQAQLKEHNRTHTGERPFQCPECPQTFTYNSVLKKHIRTHTEERPYTCTECKKSYLQLDHLKQHVLEHHSENAGGRPHKCGKCSKTYKCARSLRRHILIHKSDKKSTCTHFSE
ncbi:zinc finger protein 624-like [Drosophila erecta]|uniref:zinc finger protein 624-like n=1 Tax=Drosophila erecta TaxID=7220 RepID=UPI000F04E883|nr:zinc finger protein 624-like [Drosophila erecta]XP_026835546.1 zinc finger protein 624-like [Drosophila erecta]